MYNADDAHKAVFIKNLLDFSDDYGRSTAKSQFWYLDTADQQREILTQTTGQNTVPKTVETIIPLDRYSFFEELENKILPPMQLEFEITLQDDTELIWQNDGTDRRVVVRNFELWVPSLQFTSEGQKLVNENFLKPANWKYLQETIHASTSRRDANGVWQITPGMKNVKHVFVYIQQTQKSKNYQFNPYIFDTFNIDRDNSAALLTCRLQSGASEFYPELDYTSDFKDRILQDVIEFRYRKNDFNTGTQLNVVNYSTLYPLIYFDLRSKSGDLNQQKKNHKIK